MSQLIVFVLVEFAKIAEAVVCGNMRELRNQVIINFKTINRQYKEPYHDNTILHFVCQEGYEEMLSFMVDPNTHSEFDDNSLELNIKNDRKRTPLLLCFTPPTATVSL